MLTSVLRKLPNALSLLRLLLAPIVILLMIEGRAGWALAVFSLAGVLDAVDGWLARRFDGESRIGAYLDPLADKVLMMGTFVVLGVLGWLPAWLVVLVVFRDVAIMGAVILSSVAGAPLTVAPLTISKANTLMQAILAIAALAQRAFGLEDRALAGDAITGLVWLTAATTLASGLAYGYGWARRALED